MGEIQVTEDSDYPPSPSVSSARSLYRFISRFWQVVDFLSGDGIGYGIIPYRRFHLLVLNRKQ